MMNVDNRPIDLMYTDICSICVFSTAFMNYLSQYIGLDDPVKEAKICDLVLSLKMLRSNYIPILLNIPPLFLVLCGTRIVGHLSGLVISF